MTAPRTLTLRTATWVFTRPHLLGVLNVTPDSFSDGGQYGGADLALARADAMLEEGADALDVGGESTRPGARPVALEDELARVVPVVRALVARGAVVSVDTTKCAVARAALDAGAQIVNDVGTGDPRESLGAVAAEFGAAFLAMHARGTPESMQSLAVYEHDDPLEAVCRELGSAVEALRAAGVGAGRIALDPGLGFAKRARHSLALLSARSIATVRALGYPVCVGPSRKSFIDAAEAYDPSWGDVGPGAPSDRVGGTAAAVTAAVLGGAEMLRVHDVAAMRQAARVAHAIHLAGGG